MVNQSTNLEYNIKLIKFEGLINNNKKEGICKLGYFIYYNNKYYYFCEEANYVDNIKNGPYKYFGYDNIFHEIF